MVWGLRPLKRYCWTQSLHLIERGGIIGARRRVYTSVRTCKFATPKNQTIYQSSASNLRDYVAFGGGGDEMLIWWCFCARARKKKKFPETSRDYLKGGNGGTWRIFYILWWQRFLHARKSGKDPVVDCR